MGMARVLALVALTAALIGIALAAGPALAGKGGKAAVAGPTVTVSPNPAPLGTASINISGSGFRANQSLAVGPQAIIPTMGVTTDVNGNFSITYTPWGGPFQPGMYQVEARAYRGHRSILLAATIFNVCSTDPC